MLQTCFRRIEKKYLLDKDQYYAMLDGIGKYMERHGLDDVSMLRL